MCLLGPYGYVIGKEADFNVISDSEQGHCYDMLNKNGAMIRFTLVALHLLNVPRWPDFVVCGKTADPMPSAKGIPNVDY